MHWFSKILPPNFLRASVGRVVFPTKRLQPPPTRSPRPQGHRKEPPCLKRSRFGKVSQEKKQEKKKRPDTFDETLDTWFLIRDPYSLFEKYSPHNWVGNVIPEKKKKETIFMRMLLGSPATWVTNSKKWSHTPMKQVLASAVQTKLSSDDGSWGKFQPFFNRRLQNLLPKTPPKTNKWNPKSWRLVRFRWVSGFHKGSKKIMDSSRSFSGGSTGMSCWYFVNRLVHPYISRLDIRPLSRWNNPTYVQ